MAVVFRSSDGVILDHRQWIVKTYGLTDSALPHEPALTTQPHTPHARSSPLLTHPHPDHTHSHFVIPTHTHSFSDSRESVRLSNCLLDNASDDHQLEGDVSAAVEKVPDEQLLGAAPAGVCDESLGGGTKIPPPPPLLLQLFDIRTPFLMNGAALKISAALEKQQQQEVQLHQDLCTCRSSSNDRKKKKRRRENSLGGSNINAEQLLEYRSVMASFGNFSASPAYAGHYSYSPRPLDYRNNNKSSRAAANRLLDSTDAAHCSVSPGRGANPLPHPCNALEGCVLPPRCRYWQGDARDVLEVLPPGIKYKVVVLDPPWWNKHVRRAKKSRGNHHGYGMLGVPELLSLSLRRLLAPDAVVLIWATNNTEQLRLLTEGLEEAWGLHLLRTCYWMKVTRSGAPVCDGGAGGGKLPYERLLLTAPLTRLVRGVAGGAAPAGSGAAAAAAAAPIATSNGTRVVPTGRVHYDGRSARSARPNEATKSDVDTRESNVVDADAPDVTWPPAPGFLLVSTPSALHSHKPPLDELLQVLGVLSAEKPRPCLEVFARSLVPGWDSVGLEVLRLQALHLYGHDEAATPLPVTGHKPG